jgi:hypothetical protein
VICILASAANSISMTHRWAARLDQAPSSIPSLPAQSPLVAWRIQGERNVAIAAASSIKCRITALSPNPAPAPELRCITKPILTGALSQAVARSSALAGAENVRGWESLDREAKLSSN